MDSSVFGSFMKEPVVIMLKTGETYVGKIKQFYPDHIVFETDEETQVWQIDQIISVKRKR